LLSYKILLTECKLVKHLINFYKSLILY